MELKKISSKSAQEVAADIELSDEASSLLVANMSPAEYLQKLMDSELTSDAIKFLARALPRREATWWACVSARHAITEATTKEEIKTLELAEQWVYKPTDENRHAVHEAADPLPNESPIYWSAMASFWSGGSLGAIDTPEVKPAENICSMAVAGAVTLAGLDEEMIPSQSRYELFFKQGIAIANGDNAKEISA